MSRISPRNLEKEGGVAPVRMLGRQGVLTHPQRKIRIPNNATDKKESQSEPYSWLILALVVRAVTPDRDMVDPFTLSADLNVPQAVPTALITSSKIRQEYSWDIVGRPMH